MARKRNNRRKNSQSKKKRSARSSSAKNSSSKNSSKPNEPSFNESSLNDSSNVAVIEEDVQTDKTEEVEIAKAPTQKAETKSKKRTPRKSRSKKKQTAATETRDADQGKVLADDIKGFGPTTESSELCKDPSIDDLIDNVNTLMDDIENVEQEVDSLDQDNSEELSDELNAVFEKNGADENVADSDTLGEATCDEPSSDEPTCEVEPTNTVEQEEADKDLNEEDIIARLNKAIEPLANLESRQGEPRSTKEQESISEMAAREAREESEAESRAPRIFTEDDADAILERFELTSHRMVTLLNQKLTVTLERWSQEFENLKLLTLDSIAEPSDGDWESRRQELMKQYTTFEQGPEGSPDKLAELDCDSPVGEARNDDKGEECEIAKPGSSLVETLESLDESQSKEIAELKTKLTAKLREAEIELSINRAKLSQERAAIEQKQIEIGRRESYLRKKKAELESAKNTKTGFFDRWSRHLTFRKKKSICDLERSGFDFECDEE